DHEPLLLQTRRHFFQECGLGLGTMALASLWNDGRSADATRAANPLAPKEPHFKAKAKAVIFLFMAGGPSQMELFDYKPKVVKLHGKEIPAQFIKVKRFAFIDSITKMTPTILVTLSQCTQH